MNRPLFNVRFPKRKKPIRLVRCGEFKENKPYPVYSIVTENVNVPVNIEKKLDKMDDNLHVDEIDLEIKEKQLRAKLSNQTATVVWLVTVNEKHKIAMIDSSKIVVCD